MRDYVGTCVNSFDDEGNSINSDLPYDDVSEFARYEEQADEVNTDDFMIEVPKAKRLLKKLRNHRIELLSDRGKVWMVYDDNTDVHHFFV